MTIAQNPPVGRVQLSVRPTNRIDPVTAAIIHAALENIAIEMGRENTVGAGRWRGGIGSVREFTYLADGGFSVEGEGHKYRPWGFGGGDDGSQAELLLVSAKGEAQTLVSKVPYHKAAVGDRLLVLGPSGGGYGDPFARDAAAVLDDVLDGYISEEFARHRYGVVIADGRLDQAATAALRNGRVEPAGKRA